MWLCGVNPQKAFFSHFLFLVSELFPLCFFNGSSSYTFTHLYCKIQQLCCENFYCRNVVIMIFCFEKLCYLVTRYILMFVQSESGRES